MSALLDDRIRDLHQARPSTAEAFSALERQNVRLCWALLCSIPFAVGELFDLAVWLCRHVTIVIQ